MLKLLIFICFLITENTVLEAIGIDIPQESLKSPQIVLISTRPKPLQIKVPEKVGGSYAILQQGKEIKIDLFPPQTNPAGFLYIMQNYTVTEGLWDLINNSIIDKAGNLWFATWGGGASRYDGNSFTNFTAVEGLAGNNLFGIIQDKAGNLWFGSVENGVSCYNGKSITSYTKEQGLAGNSVKSIFEDTAGNLWFGTLDGGLSLFNRKSFTNYTKEQGLADNTVYCILEDKIGNLWFGTGGGISRYNGNSFHNYTEKDGLVNNKVYSILQDHAGNLWFGTEGGVSRYDGNLFENFTTDQGLVNNTVWSILEDKEEVLWFGTNGGLSRYDGKSFTTLTTNEGLANNIVKSIVQDNMGNLWFGTGGGGVNRYDGKAFTNYTRKQGIFGGFVRGIIEDNSGILWFTTDTGGVIRYDGKTFTYYTMNQGLAENTVYSVYKDKADNLWFGTTRGVSRYDGKSFTTFTTEQGLVSNVIKYILEDKMGNMWFCAVGGVSKYDGISFTNFTKDHGLYDYWFSCVCEDNSGNLWFGTLGHGVIRYDGKFFTLYTQEQGLPRNFINNIQEDNKGNLWFATDNGLSRYDGKSFSTLNTKSFPDNRLNHLTISKEQHILVGTNNGLVVHTGYSKKNLKASIFDGRQEVNKEVVIPAQNNLTNKELEDYEPVFEIYNTNRGYPIQGVSMGQKGIYVDSNGIIWIGTYSNKTGLVRFDYGALHRNKNPPNVSIHKVKIDNEEITWYDLLSKNNEDQNSKSLGTTTLSNITEEAIVFGNPLSNKERDAMKHKFRKIKFDNITPWYPVPKNLVLPYDLNNITIEFGAIEPAMPQDVLYQYKLVGYDKDWSPAKNDIRANFNNIFEGTYDFKVKAQSPYGIWSEPITYTFKVLPPWYRTWWAISLYAISCITIVYLIFLWRTALLRKRYRHLERLYTATERFVPKAFLNLLQKEHIEDVKLGDCVEKNITVLFNDIRSFTTLVESFTPHKAFAFVNQYWKFIAPIIRNHQGYIDQFQGDGLLAIFPNNPEDAVKASVAMMDALAEFNARQSEMKDESVRMGVGISTGPAMLGVIGEEGRHVAGLISDVANTSARVEGLNKIYGSRILLSGTTVSTLSSKTSYRLRKLDLVLLKGKIRPTEIHELIEWANKLNNISLEEYLKIFYINYQHYFEGRFDKAILGFRDCLTYYPDDKAVQTLLQRSETFQKNPPLNWNGIFMMTTK